jgi:ABC-type Fe3+-hydroxamate transport system substrate-binding protein
LNFCPGGSFFIGCRPVDVLQPWLSAAAIYHYFCNMLFTSSMAAPSSVASLPLRIVSLVPSITELLHYLGLEAVTVGITQFCLHPPHWKADKTIIGGTKTVKLPKVESLRPTLVIASKEENVQAQVETLAQHCPVYLTDVQNLPGALQMIQEIGRLTGTEAAAETLVQELNNRFAAIASLQQYPVDTAYLIWRKPYMTVGGDTFIHHLLQLAGCRNVFGQQARYPTVTPAQLTEAGCKVLLLSSEPYPFKDKHIAELQEQLPHVRILLADGELFSWYGSRLLHSPAYFLQLQQLIKGL